MFEYNNRKPGLRSATNCNLIQVSVRTEQVKHHKVPHLFVGTKKWQSVRRQNGSGCVEICREKSFGCKYGT